MKDLPAQLDCPALQDHQAHLESKVQKDLQANQARLESQDERETKAPEEKQVIPDHQDRLVYQ